MVNKWLAQELGLILMDLESYLFTIVTSIGGTKQAIGYMRQSLQLIF